jgi:Sigma-70, region 4
MYAAERNAEIARLKEAGATLVEIGDRYGISCGRVHQICALESRGDGKPDSPQRRSKVQAAWSSTAR